MFYFTLLQYSTSIKLFLCSSTQLIKKDNKKTNNAKSIKM